jgi:ubiquinone/menaquinone biosynthesis C-methylase UbiE
MELSSNFYENNCNKFSDTRFCLWDVVRDFGKQFKKDSYILDAGCGNGKNIYHFHHFQNISNIVGIDKCLGLVNICKKKGYNVKEGIVECIDYSDNTFDFVMSIAVIHHLDDENKRKQAIEEMLRVLKPNGKLLITCWAYESDEYSKKKKFKIGDNYIKFNKENILRYYYIYDKTGFENFCKSVSENVEITWDRGNWNAIFIKK